MNTAAPSPAVLRTRRFCRSASVCLKLASAIILAIGAYSWFPSYGADPSWNYIAAVFTAGGVSLQAVASFIDGVVVAPTASWG
jgi:TRAP-type C4-dicarboxylate transport system permease small subunit